MGRQVVGPKSYGHLEEMDAIERGKKLRRREGNRLAAVLISVGLGGILLILAVLMF